MYSLLYFRTLLLTVMRVSFFRYCLLMFLLYGLHVFFFLFCSVSWLWLPRVFLLGWELCYVLADQHTSDLPPQQEHSRQPQPVNRTPAQQNSLPNKNIQGSHNQETEQKKKTTTCKPYNQNTQEAITRERKPHYSEQQCPEIQQPVHLKMAI
jgi:endonuclease/exonuclease/phosphatase (EEP) superfamily protein YafD